MSCTEQQELPDADYLNDLAIRLMHVPVKFGVDQSDADRLSRIACKPYSPEPPDNPFRWYYGKDEDAEFWGGGADSREEIIRLGRERYGDESFAICEADKSMPHFDIFSLDEIEEAMIDQECWGEKKLGTGWTFGTMRNVEQIEGTVP